MLEAAQHARMRLKCSIPMAQLPNPSGPVPSQLVLQRDWRAHPVAMSLRPNVLSLITEATVLVIPVNSEPTLCVISGNIMWFRAKPQARLCAHTDGQPRRRWLYWQQFSMRQALSGLVLLWHHDVVSQLMDIVDYFAGPASEVCVVSGARSSPNMTDLGGWGRAESVPSVSASSVVPHR